MNASMNNALMYNLICYFSIQSLCGSAERDWMNMIMNSPLFKQVTDINDLLENANFNKHDGQNNVQGKNVLIVFTKYYTNIVVVVVIDLPLLRVAVEGSDNPVSLEKPCQASLPPDQQGRHSLGRHPEVQYVA